MVTLTKLRRQCALIRGLHSRHQTAAVDWS